MTFAVLELIIAEKTKLKSISVSGNKEGRDPSRFGWVEGRALTKKE